MYERRVLYTFFGGHKSIMKSFARFRVHPWLTIFFIVVVAFLSVGCKSSRSNSGAVTNPLAAYEQVAGSNSGSGSNTGNCSSSSGNVIGDGSTIIPGSLNTPVISVPEDGSATINGHDNAPLLDNKHPGWQQSNCLTCHNETTNNPDHNYNDDSLCYLCHGTNGLPGLSDSTPPVLSSVVVSPTENSVTISWKSDEPCTSRLVIKTTAGDKMEFPVSTTYESSHKRTITGLQAETTYYYELTCVDKSGNKTSSSSFSSVLSFQTLAKSTVVVASSPESGEEGGEEENLDETNGYFKSFTIVSNGLNIATIDFETLATPEADVFWWYVYPSKAEARKKAAGTNVWHDDIYANSTRKYHDNSDPIGNAEKNKVYYVRIGVTFRDGGNKWSDIRSFRFKN